MKRFKLSLSDNPTFNNVLDLTNTTFNPDNIVEGRMATEAQIQELERRYTDVEARRNYCCRDIVVWKTYTRIVSPDGIVVSPFIDNVVVGTARRGMPFTITFSPKWDGTVYEDYRSRPPRDIAGNIDNAAYWSNNFQINVIAENNSAGAIPAGATQSVREAIDYVLINSTSTKLDFGRLNRDSFYDVQETYNGILYRPESYSRNITQNCTIADADTCAPLRTLPLYTTYGGGDGGNFYIYRQGDGTITVDVKDRTVYRGVQNAFPDDPAYLMIFFTQFVLKARV